MPLVFCLVALFTIGMPLFSMAGPKESLSVSFAGRTFSLDKSPAEFPAEVKELLLVYEEYALAQRMTAVVEPHSQAVFLTSGSVAEASKLGKQVEKLFSQFESAFGKRKVLKPFPILLLKKTVQYAPLLNHLVQKYPYLSSWATSARALSGFQLYRPAIIAILQDGVKQEEYSLVNQVLHQTTHLLVGAEFEIQPFWMTEAMAWYFEEKVTGELYSFCYRDEFVFQSEHRGWDDEVRKMFQKKQFASLEDVCKSGRDKFEKKRALTGYALIHYLVVERPSLLRDVFEVLGKEHQSRFASQPTQEVEPSRQIELLQNKFGENLLLDAQTYWSKH